MAVVILPVTVLKRLDSVLIDTHDEVIKLNKSLTYKNKDPFLSRASGYKVYNTSEFTFDTLKDDPNNLDENLVDYIKGFSENAREILEAFNIYNQIERLEKELQKKFGITKEKVPRFVKDVFENGKEISSKSKHGGFEKEFLYQGKHLIISGVGSKGVIVTIYPKTDGEK